jgi:capsule polysaccharide export protein KpsE/RkpR
MALVCRFERQFVGGHKYLMRFNEIQSVKPIKPIAPMTPALARLNSLKKNVERDRQALKTERDSQKRIRDMDARYKAQLQATKAARLG